jgi:hypothetical protein
MPLTDAQVVATFGDPTPYIRSDGSIDEAWATAQLATCELPAPLPLSWDRAHTVSRLRVHRKLVGHFRRALEAVHASSAAWASLGDTGGVYAWRPQRGAKRLSRHCWGIAIDLDVADNPLGAKVAKMHPAVVAAFRAQGFEWGGSWRSRKDPMHFEFTDLARLVTP